MRVCVRKWLRERESERVRERECVSSHSSFYFSMFWLFPSNRAVVTWPSGSFVVSFFVKFRRKQNNWTWFGRRRRCCCCCFFLTLDLLPLNQQPRKFKCKKTTTSVCRLFALDRWQFPNDRFFSSVLPEKFPNLLVQCQFRRKWLKEVRFEAKLLRLWLSTATVKKLEIFSLNVTYDNKKVFGMSKAIFSTRTLASIIKLRYDVVQGWPRGIVQWIKHLPASQVARVRT